MELHFHPHANWMNDPNGLVRLGEWYHMFYQYNPHGLEWGDIHWGHARSHDLYAWEELPAAMAPDAERREQHCFSGSCCKDEQGQPHFFYTSIGYAEDGRTPFDGAEQWMAEPTDAELTQLAQTDAYALKADMHGDFKPFEWRDPCVTPYQGGYLMLLGGCAAHRGCVLLYTSQDLRHWSFRHVLAQSDLEDDVPWECPNLCFVEGKAVVFYSPCSKVRYLLGTLDEELRLHVEKQGVLDPGEHDGYYAPQVLHDDDGRCIVMGWMPECDGGSDTKRRGWNGCMALPRVLHVKDGDLTAELLDGWQAYCDDLGEQTDQFIAREIGQRFVLQTTLPRNAAMTIDLLATEDERQRTRLTLVTDDRQAIAMLDRSQSTTLDAASTKPMALCAPMDDGQCAVTVAVEENTVEVCVNGRWLSARVYPQGEADWVYVRPTYSPAAVRIYRMK